MRSGHGRTFLPSSISRVESAWPAWPGMVGRLLDEVQQCPAEVDRLGHAQQHVKGFALPLPPKTWDIEARRGADDLFGPVPPVPVRRDHLVGAAVPRHRELLFPRGELRPTVPAVDPAPLHVRQMVDHANDRKEAAVGRPPELIFVQTLGAGDDLFALALQEPEE